MELYDQGRTILGATGAWLSGNGLPADVYESQYQNRIVLSDDLVAIRGPQRTWRIFNELITAVGTNSDIPSTEIRDNGNLIGHRRHVAVELQGHIYNVTIDTSVTDPNAFSVSMANYIDNDGSIEISPITEEPVTVVRDPITQEISVDLTHGLTREERQQRFGSSDYELQLKQGVSAPYDHQQAAILDIAGSGHQNALITAGTGTGKTAILAGYAMATQNAIFSVPTDLVPEMIKDSSGFLNGERAVVIPDNDFQRMIENPTELQTFLSDNPYVVLSHDQLLAAQPYLQGRNILIDESHEITGGADAERHNRVAALLRDNITVSVTGTPDSTLLELHNNTVTSDIPLYRAQNELRTVRQVVVNDVRAGVIGENNLNARVYAALEQSLTRYTYIQPDHVGYVSPDALIAKTPSMSQEDAIAEAMRRNRRVQADVQGMVFAQGDPEFVAAYQQGMEQVLAGNHPQQAELSDAASNNAFQAELAERQRLGASAANIGTFQSAGPQQVDLSTQIRTAQAQNIANYMNIEILAALDPRLKPKDLQTTVRTGNDLGSSIPSTLPPVDEAVGRLRAGKPENSPEFDAYYDRAEQHLRSMYSADAPNLISGADVNAVELDATVIGVAQEGGGKSALDAQIARIDRGLTQIFTSDGPLGTGFSRPMILSTISVIDERFALSSEHAALVSQQQGRPLRAADGVAFSGTVTDANVPEGRSYTARDIFAHDGTARYVAFNTTQNGAMVNRAGALEGLPIVDAVAPITESATFGSHIIEDATIPTTIRAQVVGEPVGGLAEYQRPLTLDHLSLAGDAGLWANAPEVIKSGHISANIINRGTEPIRVTTANGRTVTIQPGGAVRVTQNSERVLFGQMLGQGDAESLERFSDMREGRTYATEADARAALEGRTVRVQSTDAQVAIVLEQIRIANPGATLEVVYAGARNAGRMMGLPVELSIPRPDWGAGQGGSENPGRALMFNMDPSYGNEAYLNGFTDQFTLAREWTAADGTVYPAGTPIDTIRRAEHIPVPPVEGLQPHQISVTSDAPIVVIRNEQDRIIALRNTTNDTVVHLNAENMDPSAIRSIKNDRPVAVNVGGVEVRVNYSARNDGSVMIAEVAFDHNGRTLRSFELPGVVAQADAPIFSNARRIQPLGAEITAVLPFDSGDAWVAVADQAPPDALFPVDGNPLGSVSDGSTTASLPTEPTGIEALALRPLEVVRRENGSLAGIVDFTHPNNPTIPLTFEGLVNAEGATGNVTDNIATIRREINGRPVEIQLDMTSRSVLSITDTSVGVVHRPIEGVVGRGAAPIIARPQAWGTSGAGAGVGLYFTYLQAERFLNHDLDSDNAFQIGASGASLLTGAVAATTGLAEPIAMGMMGARSATVAAQGTRLLQGVGRITLPAVIASGVFEMAAGAAENDFGRVAGGGAALGGGFLGGAVGRGLAMRLAVQIGGAAVEGAATGSRAGVWGAAIGGLGGALISGAAATPWGQDVQRSIDRGNTQTQLAYLQQDRSSLTSEELEQHLLEFGLQRATDTSAATQPSPVYTRLFQEFRAEFSDSDRKQYTAREIQDTRSLLAAIVPGAQQFTPAGWARLTPADRYAYARIQDMWEVAQGRPAGVIDTFRDYGDQRYMRIDRPTTAELRAAGINPTDIEQSDPRLQARRTYVTVAELKADVMISAQLGVPGPITRRLLGDNPTQEDFQRFAESVVALRPENANFTPVRPGLLPGYPRGITAITPTERTNFDSRVQDAIASGEIQVERGADGVIRSLERAAENAQQRQALVRGETATGGLQTTRTSIQMFDAYVGNIYGIQITGENSAERNVLRQAIAANMSYSVSGRQHSLIQADGTIDYDAFRQNFTGQREGVEIRLPAVVTGERLDVAASRDLLLPLIKASGLTRNLRTTDGVAIDMAAVVVPDWRQNERAVRWMQAATGMPEAEQDGAWGTDTRGRILEVLTVANEGNASRARGELEAMIAADAPRAAEILSGAIQRVIRRDNRQFQSMIGMSAEAQDGLIGEDTIGFVRERYRNP
ncbi:MAG: DEAD/DEAH box helicase family protein, partial [Rickettsiales bacterium]